MNPSTFNALMNGQDIDLQMSLSEIVAAAELHEEAMWEEEPYESGQDD